MPSRTRRRLLLGTVMAVAALAACGPAPSPEPSSAVEPVIAADEEGLFRLELELPKATYAAGEPIEGVAQTPLCAGRAGSRWPVPPAD